MSQTDLPIFNAVSSSARQLFLLLRCISFSPKAQVQISEEGLRFSVEESSVMEGMVFLEKLLFTSFQFNAPPSSPASDTSSSADDASTPTFSISLPSLLETLQIFGLSDTKSNPYSRDTFASNAFSNQVLGISGLCRLSYEAPGSPLTIILEESSIRTTCDLVTYEPSFTSDIPFARDALTLKVIMRASYLFDAIAELSTSNPDRVSLTASQSTFTLSASSTIGSAVVDFHRDSREPFKSTFTAPATNASDSGIGTGLLETFIIPDSSFSQTYKFSHIAATKKALAAATKVSIRADEQGVLSLQFMIENLEGGGVSFVDFRFVPLVSEEGEEGGSGSDGTDEE
jgi:cell cycle checkpoint protein